MVALRVIPKVFLVDYNFVHIRKKKEIVLFLRYIIDIANCCLLNIVIRTIFN